MVAHSGKNWKLAPSLIALEDEANAMAPSRSTASDGSIGDARHSATTSDHNPDGGWVDAIDITHDPANGMDIHALVRDISARNDNGYGRVKYIISNRQIWNPHRGDKPGVWRTYTGSNPHTKHAHVSVLNQGRNITAPWFAAAEPTPPSQSAPPPATEIKTGEPEMFLVLDGIGIYAVVDGIPIGFGSLQEYAEAKAASPGIPTMTLRGEQAAKMNSWLLRKLAAIVG